MSIGNPAGAFGQTAYAIPTAGYIEVVNASTSTIAKNDAVALTSSASRQVVISPTTITSKTIFGVADDDIAASQSGLVCINGFHLVKVSTSAIPAYNDLLGASTSGTGMVKLSTDSTAVGTHIGIAQSSTLDTTDTDTILAYIQKM